MLQCHLRINADTHFWKFHNVKRTVKDSFHTLRTDLDIRSISTQERRQHRGTPEPDCTDLLDSVRYQVPSEAEGIPQRP